jgi:ribosomal protein S16
LKLGHKIQFAFGRYWFSVGAQPTDTVRGLYRAGLMKPPTQP